MEFHLLLLNDSLDLRVFGADDLQQILSESLRTRNLLFIWTTDAPSSTVVGWHAELGHERDVNVHWLLSFSPRLLIYETRAETFDLYPRLCLLLDILHKNTLVEVSTVQRAQAAQSPTDGPTTFALTLKFRIDSRPTGSFSSGHLRCKWREPTSITKCQGNRGVPSPSVDPSYPPRGTLDPCL